MSTGLVKRKLVCIESPFAGDRERNSKYLAAAIKDCINLGEAPFAMHGFYPQFLDDNVPGERELGMNCGFNWMLSGDLVAVYYDLGISAGMREGIVFAAHHALRLEFRSLDAWQS